MKKIAIATACAITLMGALPAMPAQASTTAYATMARTFHYSNISQRNLRTVAERVQKAFDRGDLEAFASLCNYPLSISYGDGTLEEVKDKKSLVAMGKDWIFTQKLSDAIASTNVAKLVPGGRAGTQMGGDVGLSLYQFKGRWKVNSIYTDASSKGETVDIADLQEAATTIQKSFSYKDLETLAKMCNYPMVISYANGHMVEIKDQKAFIAQGEDKLFTEKLSRAIDKVEPSKLYPVGDAGVQMGGDSGLALYKFNGFWKINNIYQ